MTRRVLSAAVLCVAAFGSVIAAQTGISGSTVIEDRVTLAGQVGVAGHLLIGKGVVATAQSGIPNSVDAGASVARAWATPCSVRRAPCRAS